MALSLVILRELTGGLILRIMTNLTINEAISGIVTHSHSRYTG